LFDLHFYLFLPPPLSPTCRANTYFADPPRIKLLPDLPVGCGVDLLVHVRFFEMLFPKGNRNSLTACGKSPVLKGHGFSRATNATKQTMGFSPC